LTGEESGLDPLILCRAGSSAPWFIGDNPRNLAPYANLSDRSAKSVVPHWTWFEDFEDGYVMHAPVGSFSPNGLGLCDMVGNVWEWCRGGLIPYTVPPDPGDGLRGEKGLPTRVMRGGAFNTRADYARSAMRGAVPKHDQQEYIGLRAARALIR
jgi:formylglycine-generating enzyme required for sulfatase activity